MARPPSDGVRPLRVGEELRHVLAELFARGGLRDPALSGLILSVTEVRMTPDLKLATVFVRALAHPDPAAVLAALARETRAIRAELARRVRLRVVPELRFRTDESFDAASRVDALLRRPDVARDLEN